MNPPYVLGFFYSEIYAAHEFPNQSPYQKVVGCLSGSKPRENGCEGLPGQLLLLVAHPLLLVAHPPSGCAQAVNGQQLKNRETALRAHDFQLL